MKKVLLLGAISPFCDLVNEIVKLGFEPIICDYYTDAPAKKMGYPSFDVSTMDVEALKRLAEEQGVDGVVSAFSDRNLMPALHLCEKQKLNYFFSREIIECLTDKKNMKEFFIHHNFPVVKYGIYEADKLKSELKDYRFPVVAKPIDAYGSKGIFVCQNAGEVLAVSEYVLKQSLKYSDKLIIEEFYCADEISISAWVKSGEAYISCIYDVFRNFEDNVTLSAVSFPSKYTMTYLKEFKDLINKIVKRIGITDGPVTLQCFIGDEGIKVSELLCRLAGGSPYLYPTYFGGPNLAKMLVQNAVGDQIDYQNLIDFIPLNNSNKIFFDVQILVKAKGQIHYKILEDEVKNKFKEIVDFRVYYPDGSELINTGNGVTFAKVICELKKTDDYVDFIKRLEAAVKVYDDQGSEVQFIRIPDKLNITKTYDINWDFMDK